MKLQSGKMNPNLDVFNKENFDFEAFNDVNFEGTLETFTVFVPTDVVNLTRVQDDYDYDMETSHNIFFWDELLPTLIVYCLTFVLGLVGNVLIIFTIFRYRKMKSTTNVFLASLASSDLLLILFCIPVKFHRFSADETSEGFHPVDPKGLVCEDEAKKNGRTGRTVRKMEKKKKEKKESPKKFSIDDRFRKWHFPGRSFKENILKNTSDVEKDKKHKRKLEKQKSEEGRERMKSPKRSFPFLEVKTFLTQNNSKYTTKEPDASVKEEKTKKKKKEKETAVLKREVSNVPCFTKSSERINLEELKYNIKKECALKEKKKRLERSKKRRKNEKYEMVKVVHPSFLNFEKKHDSKGKTVVIYHRQNRKYLHRHGRDGYPFEQVSYIESCETTMEPLQSKRSFSEPRQKDYYVARRRTRFPVEPFKMVSPDFRTAIDFFKQTNGSFEYNKFEDITNSQNFYKKSKSRLHKLSEPKSTTNLAELVLENTAEKKLNLHRELIRSENSGKKKFWDSIDESLNYRCALAEMFSTQSFLTKESSFIRNANVLPKANIYVRESVISSYHVSSGDLPSTMNSFQGFGRFQTSPLQITQPLKTFTTFLIKGNSENESDMPLRNQKFGSKSTNDSVSAYQMWDESESLPRKESSLERDSQLESLMSKLSEEITKCSRYLRKLEEEKSINTTTYENTAPLDWKTAKNPIFVYSTTKMEFDRHNKIIHPKDTDKAQPKSVTSKQKNEISSSDNSSLKSPQKSDSLSTDLTKDSDKTEKFKTTDSTTTQSSMKEKYVSNSSGKENKTSMRKDNSITNKTKSSKLGPIYLDEFTCCNECNRLKVKILKLQKELEKLEKKMPLYPKDYQESVRECLESLRMTSDTFLKRMKSCAKLRQRDRCKKQHHQTHSKRTLSAPPPVIHEFQKKSVDLGQTNSDYRMNVGLEIKMENVDPVTGKKLHPPAKEGFQQEGNVKCRVFQDGKKPLLVLDTDFLYSPEKGMLFGKKDESLSTDLVIPLSKAAKPEPFKQFQYVALLPETQESQIYVNEYSDAVNSEDLFDVYSIDESKPSLSKECTEKPKETKPQVLQNHSKTVSFCTKKNEKPSSLIPILRRPLPPTFPKTWASRNSSTSTVTIFPAEIRTGQFASILKGIDKRFSSTPHNAMEKSCQTYPKSTCDDITCKNVGTQNHCSARNCGMQTEMKKRNEKVQTRLSPEPPPKKGKKPEEFLTMNAGIQVNTFGKKNAEKNNTVTAAIQVNSSAKKVSQKNSIALQTNLPTEENLKFLNDLQVQKKVNLAIAELCFHLSQENEDV